MDITEDENFCADSYDREKVRGLLEMWGYRESMDVIHKVMGIEQEEV